jgi:hypothetical protein
VEKSLTPVTEKYPLVALVVILPLVWLLSALSIALTFAIVRRLRRGDGIGLGVVLSDLKPRLMRLLAASFLNGMVVLCGLLLVLPGIYFMTIYLFVPQLVMTLPVYPASTYLHLSKNLVRTHFWSTLSVVLLLFLSDLGLYVVGETLGTWIGGWAENDAARDGLLIGTKMVLSLLTSAGINVGISYFFLELQEEPPRVAAKTSEPAVP